MISVKDLGVRGNGTTDDTLALARAIQRHRHVYLPPGDYRVTSLIHVPPQTRIQGAGRDTTRIFDDGGSHSFFVGTDSYGIEIDHLTIEGNYPLAGTGNNAIHDAINFFGKNGACSGFDVHHCRFRNIRGRAVVFVRHCTDVFVHDNIIENCSIGVFLFGGVCRGFVSQNVMRCCRIGGIFVDDATNFGQPDVDAFRPFYHTIQGNQIVRSGYDPVQTGFGIGVSASHGVVIANNVLDWIGEYGVVPSTGIIVNAGQDDLFHMQNVAINGNVVTNGAAAGIFLEAVQNFSITGNTLVDNGQSAEIYVRPNLRSLSPSVSGMITGNLVRKTTLQVAASSLIDVSHALNRDVVVANNGVFGSQVA